VAIRYHLVERLSALHTFMVMKYRTIVWTLLFATAVAKGAELTPAADLAADAARSVRDQQPVVVMFSSDGCPYCRVVTRYLELLASDPLYSSRAQVRLVETGDSSRQMVDFTGRRLSHAGFARSQGVGLVPVVRFFGPGGERLAPDLVGLGVEDFYLTYLLDKVNAARAKLQPDARSANGASSGARPAYAGG